MTYNTLGDLAVILARYYNSTITIACRSGVYTVTISHSNRCAAAQHANIEVALAAAVADAQARFDRGAA